MARAEASALITLSARSWSEPVLTADVCALGVARLLSVLPRSTRFVQASSAEVFGDATEVTGVVLTKLDGSAKGGIVFAIETELGIPVKLVGLGEQIGDLVPFDPTEFVSALFSEN